MQNIKIIAHRGYWKTELEKNTMAALKRAIDCGYGFETDLRDCGGTLVISHNPPKGNEITVESVFEMYSQKQSDVPLALNIKADGLQEMLAGLLAKYNINNYFVFDMSVCDTLSYISQHFKIASRRSEYEKDMPFYMNSTTVWVDFFMSDSLVRSEVENILKDGKIACVVSPELHGRDYSDVWNQLKYINNPNLYLCTDYPEEADNFFNEQ